jgi:serine/threonine-protein kinase PknG
MTNPQPPMTEGRSKTIAQGSVRCLQSGCTGTIDDGYCDICGMAGAKSASTASVSASSSGASLSQVSGEFSTRVSQAVPSSGILSSRSGLSGLSSLSTGISSSVTGVAGTKGTRRSTSVSRSTRKKLGAGLISLPELPSIAPESVIMNEAIVPEHKRFCGNSDCGQSVKREKGFCPVCGQKYSFIASLKPGDRVAGQYEVKGAIAFGGLGWVYLGYDLVLSRYVVLKGLLNTEDASSAAVAVAEKQFLASVKHANIVGIYNFVSHGVESFIVMEYVGGKTLKEIRKERGILPVAEAIAYIHRILSAFSYLHGQNLVYCDFKPDNILIEGDDVKLIDMGGVRRIDDPDGDIYGTVGYTAPEAGEGPTIVTDLYTVARTLAILICSIRGFNKEHLYSLPTPKEEPLFAKYESLYRFLLRSTASDPNARFQTADEMADQLLGVMREVVAADRGTPCPSVSSLFGNDRLSYLVTGALDPIGVDARQIPMPLMGKEDPALPDLMNAMSLLNPAQRVDRLVEISWKYPKSVETKLQLVEHWLAQGEGSRALPILEEIAELDPWEWRATWNWGRVYLVQKNSKEAIARFDRVYTDLPGELAPQIALALALEQNQNYSEAIFYYQRVLQTNPDYPSAAFGQARCYLALQTVTQNKHSTEDCRNEAVKALQQIPPTSSLHLRSQAEMVKSLASIQPVPPTPQTLTAASTLMHQLSLQGMERYHLLYMLYSNALQVVKQSPHNHLRSLGTQHLPLTIEELKTKLEEVLKGMAHLSSGDEKIRLIDEANRVRCESMF